MSEAEPVAPVEDGWLVVIDAQAIFADPATSPWGSPMWAATVPRIRELATAYGPARTILTRFVADPGLGGSWAPYYDEWPFALVPDTDPLYAVVPDLADVADHVVTAGTFGKWPVLRELVGDGLARGERRRESAGRRARRGERARRRRSTRLPVRPIRSTATPTATPR